MSTKKPKTDLQKLEELFDEYRLVSSIHKVVNLKWYTWNYQAEKMTRKYQEWKKEHGLDDIDVRAKKDMTRELLALGVDPKTFAFKWEDGIVLWSFRSLKWRELEQLRLQRSQLLRKIVYERNEDDTDWKYTGEELAKAAGYSSASGLWRMLAKQDWFEYRRNYPAQRVAIAKREA